MPTVLGLSCPFNDPNYIFDYPSPFQDILGDNALTDKISSGPERDYFPIVERFFISTLYMIIWQEEWEQAKTMPK